MTYRKPLLVLAVLAALSAGVAFAADNTPPDQTKPLNAKFVALDKNGDGVIDRSEAVADPKLAAKFDELDKNKDGKLTPDEFRHRFAYGEHGRYEHHGRHGEHGRALFAKLDANKDGRISREEAQADPKFAARFDRLDVNKDGFVDKADFEARAKQRRDEWFAAADTNKDGKLSKAEFDAAAAKHGRFGREFGHGPRDGRGPHDGKQWQHDKGQQGKGTSSQPAAPAVPPQS